MRAIATVVLWGVLMSMVVTFGAAQSVLKHRPVGPSLSQAEYESPYAIYMHPGAHGDLPWYDTTSGTLRGLPIGPDGAFLEVSDGEPVWNPGERPYDYALLESDAERGPIHHYRLNDAVTVSTSTQTIADQGILGTVPLTASVVADTWTTAGVINQGFNSSSYTGDLRTAYSGEISHLKKSIVPVLTLTMWAKIVDFNTDRKTVGYQCIFGPKQGPNYSGRYFVFGVYDEIPFLEPFAPGSSNNAPLAFPANVGMWDHYVAVYNVSTVDFYRNGSLIGSNTIDLQNANANILVNARRTNTGGTAPSQYIQNNILIDDARIYDYALSPEQVARLYNEGYGTEASITTGTAVLAHSTIYDSGGRTYVGTAMPEAGGEIQFATSATTRMVLDDSALTVSVPIVGDLVGDVTGNADTATTATVALSAATVPNIQQVLDSGSNATGRDLAGVGTLTATKVTHTGANTGGDAGAIFNATYGDWPVRIVNASVGIGGTNPHKRALQVDEGNVAILDGNLSVSGTATASTFTASGKISGGSIETLSSLTSNANVEGRLRVGSVGPDDEPAITVVNVSGTDGRALLAQEGDVEISDGNLSVSGTVTAGGAALSTGTVAHTPSMGADLANKAYVDNSIAASTVTLAEGAERGPIHHYKLNDTGATTVVKDQGIGHTDLGIRNMIARQNPVVAIDADDWSGYGKISRGFQSDTMYYARDINETNLSFYSPPISICAWIYMDPDIPMSTTSYYTIFGITDGGDRGYYIGLSSVDNANGTYQVAARRGGSSTATPNGFLSVGQWYHITVIYTGVNTRIYVDTVMPVAAGAAYNTTSSFVFPGVAGRFGSSNPAYAPITVDDARIYDYDITYGGTDMSIIGDLLAGGGIYNSGFGTESLFVKGLLTVPARSSIVNDAGDTFVSTMYPTELNKIMFSVDGIRRGLWDADHLELYADLHTTGTVTAATFTGDWSGYTTPTLADVVGVSGDAGAQEISGVTTMSAVTYVGDGDAIIGGDLSTVSGSIATTPILATDITNKHYVDTYREKTIMLDGDVPMVFVRIPAGTFLMSSPADEVGRDATREDYQHRVTLTQDFWMGKYEVTQAQWTAVMGTTPWAGQDYVLDDPNAAATYVSWNDIATATTGFMDQLTSYAVSTGQAEMGDFRLPTEAQWEYAARGGTQTRFYWGDDLTNTDIADYAWYSSARDGQWPHVVGRKRPNRYGLYDMSGNVFEWCNDWYVDGYSADSVINPTGAVSGTVRVLRGGSWYNLPSFCRSAGRVRYTPSNSDGYGYGFRVVAVLGEKTYRDFEIVGDFEATTVTAGAYLDSTPGWSRSSADALTAILGLGYETRDGRVKIDHNTLPIEAQAIVGYRDVPTGEYETVAVETEAIPDKDGKTPAEKTITYEQRPITRREPVLGRDLGALITIQSEAIKALDARLRALEKPPIGEVRQ